MIYLDLFWGFLKVGTFSFGGGYAAIPLIRDIVRSYGWLSDEALTDIIAISESTPGPIMVNLATYVGSTQAGVVGAILATMAVVLPAFLVVVLVVALLKNALQNAYVQAALNGMKPCIIGIILATGAHMLFKTCLLGSSGLEPKGKHILVAAMLLFLMVFVKKILKKKFSGILLILVSACIGVVVF